MAAVGSIKKNKLERNKQIRLERGLKKQAAKQQRKEQKDANPKVD